MRMAEPKIGYPLFSELIAAGRQKLFPASNDQPGAIDYAALYDAFASAHPQDDYDRIHGHRFRETARLFGRYLEGKTIIELGAHCRIGLFAEKTLGAQCVFYEKELREPYEIPSHAFDAALCFEVLEHMKDRTALERAEHGDIGTWNYSGALNLLNESYRIIKPGGVLLITTPNCTSVDAIATLMSGDGPFMFDPHVRELPPIRVRALAELAGFTLESFGTIFAWKVFPDELRRKILKMIEDLGFNPEHRGDDSYYVFRR